MKQIDRKWLSRRRTAKRHVRIFVFWNVLRIIHWWNVGWKQVETHQIRVHMRYIDHPIVGDEKYGYRRTMKIGGQLLHAHQLEFVHPSTGEKMVVEAEIPQDFAEVLQRLRAERDA